MKILNLQTKNITLAACILAFFSSISALLGLLRDRLLAGHFGAGNELDIYYAAFRIPDFFSMILIMGSISAAIVPLFSQYISKSRDEAWEFLSNLINLLLVILSLVSLLLVFLADPLIDLIVPGFSEEKKEMVVLMTRIMFLGPMILGISNIISAVLQVFGRFLVTSLSPILYNLGIIIGIIFFVPRLGITGLAWGVVFGALLHLLIQVPTLFKAGFKFKKIFDLKHPGFRQAVKLTIPRSIGLAATQIDFFVVTSLASTLSAGSVAIFNLAESLSRPFLILVGISFSTAAFPKLALSFTKENKEKFLKIYSLASSRILLLILPLSILLFLFREQLVSFIFKVGKFGFADSHLTAACLAAFALGLFARSLILLKVKAFYALQDTKTPAVISIVSMLITVGLCFLFLYLLSFENSFQGFFTRFFSLANTKDAGLVGLPLAVSLSSIIQLILLSFSFDKRLKKYNGKN